MNRDLSAALAGLGALIILIAGYLFVGDFITELPFAYDPARLPRISLGQPLDFRAGANRSALLAGWSLAEPWGTWSDGPRSYIGIVLRISAGEDHPASLRARAHVSVYLPPGVPEQNVAVLSSAKPVATLALRRPEDDMEFPLLGVEPADGRPVLLEFRYANAISPLKAQKTRDPRALAIGIISLTIMAD